MPWDSNLIGNGKPDNFRHGDPLETMKKAKRRQMMARTAAKWAMRMVVLMFAWLGVFALVTPYATMGVSIVFAFLAEIPMMWGMEESER